MDEWESQFFFNKADKAWCLYEQLLFTDPGFHFWFSAETPTQMPTHSYTALLTPDSAKGISSKLYTVTFFSDIYSLSLNISCVLQSSWILIKDQSSMVFFSD